MSVLTKQHSFDRSSQKNTNPATKHHPSPMRNHDATKTEQPKASKTAIETTIETAIEPITNAKPRRNHDRTAESITKRRRNEETIAKRRRNEETIAKMKPPSLPCMSHISAELRIRIDKMLSPDNFFLGSTMYDNTDRIPPGIATDTSPFETLVCRTTHHTSDEFPLVPPDAKMSNKGVLT